MNKFLIAFVITSLFLPIVSVQAQKGASDSAKEHASDQAIFNRVRDWFSTIGKNDEEKKKIKAERKAKREKKRMEKEARKASKKAEKMVKEGKEDVEKAKDKMGKKNKSMKKMMDHKGEKKKKK